MLDRDRAVAEITVTGPSADAPASMADVYARGAAFWPLAVARELDDLILDLRTNETEIGTWVLRTVSAAAPHPHAGSAPHPHAALPPTPTLALPPTPMPSAPHPTASEQVLAYDALLLENATSDWLANEIVLYLKRTLKRLDVTSRSLIALIEPGSCFAGSLLELALAADRSYMLFGVFEDVDPDATPAAPDVGPMNVGPLPMGNGLTRLQTRFFGDEDGLAAAGRPSARRWRPRRRRSSAWSPSLPTTSTGRRRCGSRWKSGRPSRPTR